MQDVLRISQEVGKTVEGSIANEAIAINIDLQCGTELYTYVTRTYEYGNQYVTIIDKHGSVIDTLTLEMFEEWQDANS